MSDNIKVITNRSNIVAIADAVREQTGSTEQMSLNDIADEIRTLSVGDSSGSISVQADWQQNDETAPDYIKNRTHWIEDDGETYHSLDEKFIPDTIATKDYVESFYKKLSSDRVLRFYCVEEVTIILNGESIVYPANSNVEIKFLETDVFEIVPTSNNSILALNAFPGALGTFYPWLEGVKQFSNILFDMNAEDMYSKWSQGNQGSYQVQYAQYLNCIFWSDNPYISDVARRTNYTLYYSSQLPLCYSTIPDNTFKAFYLAFNVNSDPNWGNMAYRDSFAKATWATQVFSYYGARTIGIFGHDDPDFNIILPKDCRGLMCEATAIENAGTFDAINVTNFGAKSGSWRDAFRMCSSLRNLYIKNLKVNLNISWSPINYDSIYFIISEATNTNAITISLSPYTYYLLSASDFELAASKNITIELLTTNYVEDIRLSSIADKQNKNIIVTKGSDGLATYSPSEILEAVNNGINVYYAPSANAGTLHPYLEGSSQVSYFHSNYIDNSRVVATGFLIDSNKNITVSNYSALNNYYNKTEVDESIATKANATDVLIKTQQDLTDEEINQVRENLRLIGKNVEGQTFIIDGEEIIASENAEIFGDYDTNIATGQWSIAEGSSTIAKGVTSHAEGTYTIASGAAQHVEGSANIEDTEDKYIHIAGNGVDSLNRSNAYTLDWDGNGWFAGNVEATAIILRSSTEGSTKTFRLTVDDSGTLNVVENV